MCKCQKSCKLVYYVCASLLMKSFSSLISSAPYGWVKVFFLEVAQLGYQGPEFTCPYHDSTSTGTIGTCLL